MKKLITLLLVLTGMVGTASADDYCVVAYEGSSWTLKGTMTNNGDGTYTYLLEPPHNYGEYIFTIFTGTTFSSEDWTNKWHPKDASNDVVVNDNPSVTMEYGNSGHVLKFYLHYPHESPTYMSRAYVLRIDFTPSTGACTVTRQIAVMSSSNSWATPVGYLSAGTASSEVYTGEIELSSSEQYCLKITNDNYSSDAVTAGIYDSDNSYYATSSYSNITVAADGVYSWTVNIWTYTAPSLVTIPASVGTYGMATLCSKYALDFTNVSTVTAYTITGNNSSTGELTKAQVTGKVPANTGLYIEGSAGASADVPTTICTTSAGTNKLVGVTSATVISQTDGTNTNYILTRNTANGNVDTPKFYKVNTAGNTVPAGKAYLQIPTANAAPEFFWFGSSTPTDIDMVHSEGVKDNGSVFNLAGQRVAHPTKGLYIVNGRKVVIK